MLTYLTEPKSYPDSDGDSVKEITRDDSYDRALVQTHQEVITSQGNQGYVVHNRGTIKVHESSMKNLSSSRIPVTVYNEPGGTIEIVPDDPQCHCKNSKTNKRGHCKACGKMKPAVSLGQAVDTVGGYMAGRKVGN